MHSEELNLTSIAGKRLTILYGNIRLEAKVVIRPPSPIILSIKQMEAYVISKNRVRDTIDGYLYLSVVFQTCMKEQVSRRIKEK